MKNPSIRLRLILGTGVLVALTLWGANVAIYKAFKRTLYKEVDSQLMQNISLLAKSAELEANSLDYEWQEAMKSSNAPEILGVFAFWDLASGRVTKSPELGDRDLPLIYGELDKPVKKQVVLANGHRARVVGLLHYPFIDKEAIERSAAMGKVLRPAEHPQVVVCARETESLIARLDELKGHLTRAAIATLIAIWGSIFAISTWSLRPIRDFSTNLLERSESETPAEPTIPTTLPSELVGLAETFNLALRRIEKSRDREKEFAIHAAHELRTPVAGIYATLEQALLRERPALDLRGRIQAALQIVSGMKITLDSLMRLARLRGGVERSTKAMFEPSVILHEILDPLAGTLAERDLNLIVDVPAAILPVENDRGLFKSVVSNLTENAVRYTPPGGDIHIQLVEEAGQISFTCTNSADGDPEKMKVEEWFQPFHRGSDAADDEGGHAGLGLSIAREAARILGGTLQVSVFERTKIRFTLGFPR